MTWSTTPISILMQCQRLLADAVRNGMQCNRAKASLFITHSCIAGERLSKEFGSIGKDISTSGLTDTNIRLSFTFYGE
jgi:hypothetical protein